MNLLNHLLYKIKYTMRFSILSIFISLFVTSILILTLIMFFRFSESISKVAFKYMEGASLSLYEKIENELHDISVEIRMFERLVGLGVINTDNSEDIIDYIKTVLTVESETIPSLQGVYFADEKGNFFMARKIADSSVLLEIINRKQQPYKHTFIYHDHAGNILNIVDTKDFTYDPRIRPWYILAKKINGIAWTDVYPYHLTGNLGITVAKPLYKTNTKLVGVVAFNLRLDYIRRFIEGMKISPNGIVYIVTLNEKVIALPYLVQYQSSHLINIHELKIPWLITSFDIYKEKLNPQFKFRYAGENYLAIYRPLPQFGADKNWLIGMVSPEKDFIAELLQTNLLAIIISLVILLFGIFLMTNLVNRIVNPLRKVVQETEKIKHFELDETSPLSSRIKEINTLSEAVYRMKQGLRSFKKYVPANLVQQLIASGKDVLIGGEKRQLAIFFSDIENFTSISEQMDPDILMEYICEYFNEVSPIIVEESGTIDKYIGDSIMAFWGAPLPTNHPCDCAARTALRCLKRIEEFNLRWQKKARPPLNTRIGLHFGEAIVGNLGSNERLNYTAVGDSINTTNRLENINKFYATKIIVSDAFYHEIKYNFALRMIDCIALKGKAQGTYIYELLGEHNAILPFNIDEYQKIFALAFSAYKQQQWNVAKADFELCLEIYPNDKIAPIFIKRCQYFSTHSPGKDWNGVWHMQEK